MFINADNADDDDGDSDYCSVVAIRQQVKRLRIPTK